MAKNGWLIIVIAAVVIFLVANGGFKFGGNNGGTNDSASCPDSAATVSWSAINKDTAAAITTGQTVKVNGGNPTASTTSYAVGARLEVLWNASNYLDKIQTYTVPCGGGPLEAQLYATDDMSFKVFNTDGNPVTDSATGGATNQTVITAGGSANLQIQILGKDDESSGDLIIVLEHANTTAVDKLTLSGISGITDAAVPNFYAVQSANSKAVAYRVPAVVGANTVTGTLGIKQKSGQTYGGAIYITAYSIQAYQETDGTFKEGVEDLNDNTKYEDDWDFDFYVNAA